MNTRNAWCALFVFILLLGSCAVRKPKHAASDQLSRIAKFAQDSVFKSAHMGFVLIDEKTGNTVEAYQADKYFIPASNTKLFTTYASLKYLGDSLPGFYQRETKDTFYLKPNGDPTFLHRNFKDQKVFDKIKATSKVVVLEKVNSTALSRLGNGWNWSGYQSLDMLERNAMPIYSNLVRFTKLANGNVAVLPKYFLQRTKLTQKVNGNGINVNRLMDDNTFTVSSGTSNSFARPFTYKSDSDLAYRLLQDTLATLHKTISIVESQKRPSGFWKPFYTQLTADVVKPMMYVSDNFLAEQLLVMVGMQLNGEPNERLAINRLNKDDFSKLSSPFLWYDGSGLSRYNNVTPRALTDLMAKMKKELGWEKVTAVVPGGNQGSLTGYYKGYEKNIYCKGGRLGSTSLTLSGYLITKKGNNYLFSFQTNNHAGDPERIRRAYEKYLIHIIENQ